MSDDLAFIDQFSNQVIDQVPQHQRGNTDKGNGNADPKYPRIQPASHG
jgi:hypothetical protein